MICLNGLEQLSSSEAIGCPCKLASARDGWLPAQACKRQTGRVPHITMSHGGRWTRPRSESSEDRSSESDSEYEEPVVSERAAPRNQDAWEDSSGDERELAAKGYLAAVTARRRRGTFFEEEKTLPPASPSVERMRRAARAREAQRGGSAGEEDRGSSSDELGGKRAGLFAARARQVAGHRGEADTVASVGKSPARAWHDIVPGIVAGSGDIVAAQTAFTPTCDGCDSTEGRRRCQQCWEDFDEKNVLRRNIFWRRVRGCVRVSGAIARLHRCAVRRAWAALCAHRHSSQGERMALLHCAARVLFRMRRAWVLANWKSWALPLMYSQMSFETFSLNAKRWGPYRFDVL